MILNTYTSDPIKKEVLWSRTRRTHIVHTRRVREGEGGRETEVRLGEGGREREGERDRWTVEWDPPFQLPLPMSSAWSEWTLSWERLYLLLVFFVIELHHCRLLILGHRHLALLLKPHHGDWPLFMWSTLELGGHSLPLQVRMARRAE